MTLALLLMLLVGIVSAAVAFGQSNSIQNAAREASRFAATLDDVDSKLDQVIGVARAAASGDLSVSDPGVYICVAYVDGSGAVTSLDVPDIVAATTACYADGRTEERVQVVAERESTVDAILFSTDVSLSAQAAARFER